MLNSTFYLFILLLALYIGIGLYGYQRGEVAIGTVLEPLGYAVTTLFGVLIGVVKERLATPTAQ
jgi:hypothetical protein